jgi:hypothetical protein
MNAFRSLVLCLALLLTSFVPLARAADGDKENTRMTYDNMPAEKTERSPVLQYALACLMALCFLVVICMPARKAH